ncbi:hypothetical protein EV643_104298 [Kribbella sp. VKM Ac-2527]|uniref:Uncharacterized protein n=2 Tax=Kribbella caucasensis TaxID=2512215 RepID=A0A4R6KIT5_9ACTN|nr:hypothetical protein EV643_104298 [Kribbella sp. VKM Ac-2527]
MLVMPRMPSVSPMLIVLPVSAAGVAVPGVLPVPRSFLQYHVRSVRALIVRCMSTMSRLPSA